MVLVSIPKTFLIKVAYCTGMGSNPIGSTPSFIGDGSDEFCPPQSNSLRTLMDLADVSVMMELQFSTEITAKIENFTYPLLPRIQITERQMIMKITLIPAYFLIQ